MTSQQKRRVRRLLTVALVASAAMGCTDYEGFTILPYDPATPSSAFCDIDETEIFQGGPKDVFEALSNPTVVPAGHADASYLEDDDLVVGMRPQMSRGARCGPRLGTELDMVPVMELTWGAWRAMYPQTWVLSSETGSDRHYDVYPYGDYRDLDNLDVLYPMDIDWQRPLKERVLGVADASGGVGYPHGELARLGPIGVVAHAGDTSAPGGAVVLWDASAETAMAYSSEVDAVELTFAVVGDAIVDQETGSVWRVDGVATSGPLEGTRLDPVAEAYTAYWFAWAAFEPGAVLWEMP
jgi:hypothetical protein